MLNGWLANRPATAEPTTPPIDTAAAPPPNAEDTKSPTAEATKLRASALPANSKTAEDNAELNADTTGEGLPPEGANSEITASSTVDAIPKGE